MTLATRKRTASAFLIAATVHPRVEFVNGRDPTTSNPNFAHSRPQCLRLLEVHVELVEETLEVEGLGQIVARAGVAKSLHLFVRRVGRQHDHRNRRRALIAPKE